MIKKFLKQIKEKEMMYKRYREESEAAKMVRTPYPIYYFIVDQKGLHAHDGHKHADG